MSVALLDERKPRQLSRGVMKANVFRAPGQFGLEERVIPKPGPGEAVVQVRLTTICDTDLRIVRGDYPVEPGLVIGHEAAGVIHELGAGVTGYEPGQRVLVGAITPCGQCEFCLGGHPSQCGGSLRGWRLGNSIDGTQAEYFLVPHAQANLATIPNSLSDAQVLLLGDVASTGFAAVERGNLHLGDTVAVYSQGPVGLCATLGARLLGAADIIAIDDDPRRLALALQFGATAIVPAGENPLSKIDMITGGRGVDVACVDVSDSDSLTIQETFSGALRALRPGGTLSSVGVCRGPLKVPLGSGRWGTGIEDHTIVSTLCPGGKERMDRLMRLVRCHRIDLGLLLTHLFTLDEIGDAYELFASRGNGVLKVGIRVS
jgi:threonine dehydrogenase-like Zn-dependent dehydrogenase